MTPPRAAGRAAGPPRGSRRPFPALLALFLAAAPLHDAFAAAAPRIRAIRVVRKDIFDVRRRSENKPLYRFINKLHVTTRDPVIRRELLLKEGDRYDPRLRKESERNLRKILRLRRVKITPIPVGEDQVDLFVEVQEAWSTEPQLNLSGVGGDVTGKVGFRERNLAGLGKEASFFYKKGVNGITRSFAYGDPNMLGTHLRLDANYDQREEGVSKAFLVERPFYSSITPWSASGQGGSTVEDVRLFDHGDEVGKLHHQTHDFGVAYARSFGSTTRRVRRAGLGVNYAEDTLGAGGGAPLLRDKRYPALTAKLQYERIDFLTVDHIRLYDRDEDFAMGPSLTVETGFARPWVRDADTATFLKLNAFAGREMGVARFSLLTLAAKGRFEDNAWRDLDSRADAEYYHHFSPRQTFAFHLQAEAITRPEPDSQLLLGGDRGLRGYQLNQFAGDRLLLANAENRFFLVDDVLKLFGLGSVIFVDSGYAWPKDRRMKLGDLKTSVGTGLRFHLSRASFGNVLRLDVAYAVDPVPGESRTVITFGSSQAF